MIGIESNKGQFRSVVGRGKTMGPPDPVAPIRRKPGRFVDMTMESEERLPGLDETPKSDASDMGIERDVIDRFALQGGEIEPGFVRRGMKEKNAFSHIVPSGQSGQIVLDRGISRFLNGNRDGSNPFLGRKTAGVKGTRNVVALPIF